MIEHPISSRCVAFAQGLLLLLVRAGESTSAYDKPIEFNRDIRGLPFDRCVACHGPDEKQRQADLRLDVEEHAKEHAIVPGDPTVSELIARITSTDAELKMPPADSGKSLTAEEIERLTRWIKEGAKWQLHWAFNSPQLPNKPPLKIVTWAQTEIDRFVLARLEAEGLSPSPQASREALIRRVTFDLTGLPPTLAEVDAFLGDESPDAFERVVDRLLASPRFGEQLATEWLQVARFADSNGYQNDFRREQWPWPDWVITAFNANLPFDQFLIEQTAGDLLPDPQRSQLVATGFHRDNRTVTEFGSIDEEWRVENTVDRVETTAIGFLGLTLGCARCHDHKYDPITQKEFYEFYGFFNSIDERGVYAETRGNVPPLISLPSQKEQQQLDQLALRIARAEESLDDHISQGVQNLIAEVNERLAEGWTPTPLISVPLNGGLKVEQRADTAQPPAESSASATFNGGQSTFSDGLFGKELKLANADSRSALHVNLGQSIQADRESALAFSIWLRPDEVPLKDGKPSDVSIVSSIESHPAMQGWDTLLLADGTLKVRLIHSSPNDAIEIISRSKLSRRQWSHLVVSYDGSGKAGGISVFVSRKPVELEIVHDTLSGTIVTEQPLRLGGHSSEANFNGALAQFQ